MKRKAVLFGISSLVIAASLALVGASAAQASWTYAYRWGYDDCSSYGTYTHMTSTNKGKLAHQISDGVAGYVETDYNNGSTYMKRSTYGPSRYADWGTIGYDTTPMTQESWGC
ncbi:hypothetical protein [Galbitalea soli]|uniref:Lactococcin 972 family bacteriocin n=1 Tax=Galbitalea soli TaxID=1268042 RepID=A0A7C9PN99_9MICO|nr:hypothetical protein [Galbitalea soli]NEM91387.1 hypothetical protein [Galbitalea soli]NYJ30078.1 hypothetical protein [Galbitalea soli]